MRIYRILQMRIFFITLICTILYLEVNKQLCVAKLKWLWSPTVPSCHSFLSCQSHSLRSLCYIAFVIPFYQISFDCFLLPCSLFNLSTLFLHSRVVSSLLRYCWAFHLSLYWRVCIRSVVSSGCLLPLFFLYVKGDISLYFLFFLIWIFLQLIWGISFRLILTCRTSHSCQVDFHNSPINLHLCFHSVLEISEPIYYLACPVYSKCNYLLVLLFVVQLNSNIWKVYTRPYSHILVDVDILVNAFHLHLFHSIPINSKSLFVVSHMWFS